MDTIRFDVVYEFREYREFAIDYMRDARGVPLDRFAERLFSVVLRVAFALKKRKMPRCDFTIDDSCIRRRTARGELIVPWEKVTRVHRFRPGYLIEKASGAMPIPLRCLDAAQRERLDALIAEHVPR